MGMGFGSSPLELLATNAMLLGEIYCEMFTYNAVWLTGTNSALAANGTTDVPIQFNADSDFIVQELEFLSWSAAGTIIALPDYLLSLTVAGAAKNLQSSPNAVRLVAGSYATSDQSCRLPFPRLFTMNSTLTCTLTNRTNTACNRAELALRGFKVFYTGGSRQKIFHVS